ncbi:adenylate/guanylate cyclase domain-containing protein [Sorangium sp. So ce315]|uniref:adenylate/guanylate cyclase domain-containing protein n=1 Tax=Sorangium sp. So ce315 TaxID=3133299 RepID=UPI003F5E6A82
MSRSPSDKDAHKKAPISPVPSRGSSPEPSPPRSNSSCLPPAPPPPRSNTSCLPPAPPSNRGGSTLPPPQHVPAAARSSHFPTDARVRRDRPSGPLAPLVQHGGSPPHDARGFRDRPSAATMAAAAARSGLASQDPLATWDAPEGPAPMPATHPPEPPSSRVPEVSRFEDTGRGHAPASSPGRRVSPAGPSSSHQPAPAARREPQRLHEPHGGGHDPYTPINQILGYTRLLVASLQGKVAPQHIEDIRNIELASRKLLRIVQAMESGGGEDDAPASWKVSVPAAHEEPAIHAELEGGGRGAILVVDDSRGNRDVLCRVLQNNGYRAVQAEDGPRALGLAARERFDAVLLDVNMPGISGLGVLSALRQSRSQAELPVIMVTTRGASEDVVESLRLGANDHVTKPIDFDILLGRLDTQLTLKRSREQLSQLASELSIKSEFIRKTFGRYLSDDVVNRLLSSPEAQLLGGEEREVTIMMTDLRSFTTMTENMPPEVVMKLLNGYLGEMARIIIARGGTIIEFIGDAILALFGAPFSTGDDARRAVACALEMQMAMDAVNDRNSGEGLPTLQMGVALNTGPVVVGNIGSEARTKYGVVGAQVNMTSRIESCTVGRQILIADSTRRAAGAGLLLGQSHALSVKGFSTRVLVHEVLGLDTPERLYLPERRVEILPLSSPLPVVCARLAGKRVEGEPQSAFILGLSPFGAVLRLHPRPAPFTNLQLHPSVALAEQLGGELHAKVIELDPRAEDVVRIHFTSSPPGLAALVQELHRAEA